MQTVLSRFWTQIAEYISNDDNNYIISAFTTYFHLLSRELFLLIGQFLNVVLHHFNNLLAIYEP